ncbi:MAG TPA: MBL fold metallo-hydrolase [Kiritimatiellia bacterium]|nr:MBL fold metallo-hydrolase [Kiritimatiellia bacterium]HRZ11841.1 MBL fold metallo-hydrolase [Kiritimatiellia bacterium]HSA17353.1 MBL fold metallo-hydrolase [Kiritimatiellia bacterium]
MSLQVCVLASGSSGNCIFVGSTRTGILIDAGLSGKETLRRLDLLEIPAARIRAVCVSHEHNDHTAGLRALQRRHGLDLYANTGTIEALQRNPDLNDLAWKVFSTGFAFSIGDLTVEPFAVSHDAYEPVGFVIAAGRERVGIATDIGVATGLVRERLKGCRVLVIESNHDERLLLEAERPWQLKQRIAGRQGHLSNASAARLVCELAGPELEHVFLVHLSEECNRQDLALKTARQMLDQAGHARIGVSLTFPDRVSEIWCSA